jgi:hypothetical protein
VVTAALVDVVARALAAVRADRTNKDWK